MYSRRNLDRQGSRGRQENRYDSYSSPNSVSIKDSVVPTGKQTYWSGEPSRYKKIQDQQLDAIIVGHLTSEQTDAYQQFFRIEEISDLLRRSNNRSIVQLLPSGDLKTHPNLKRDPSPPPNYDNQGNRVNTRDTRVKEALEKERGGLIESAVRGIKLYNPPYDYQKPIKTTEKLYIPIKDYPDINFVGFLLGPRGTTLRKIEEDSGARLAIRGKGSVKDGRSTNLPSSNNDESAEEDLHVIITADSQQKLAKGIQLTNEIIETLVSSPFGQNELKRNQLKQLAIYNGTLRETKPFDPTKYNKLARPQFDITKIVCKICGNPGHLARDCKFKNEGNFDQNTENNEEIPPWKKQKTGEVLPPWADTNIPANGMPPPVATTVSVSGGPPPGLSGPPPGLSGPPPGLSGPPPGLVPPPPPSMAKPPTIPAPPSNVPPPANIPPPTSIPAPPAHPAPPAAKPPPPVQNKPPPPSSTTNKPPPPPQQKD